MTSVFSGRPARGLQNQFTALSLDESAVPDYPIAYHAAKALAVAAKVRGEPGFGAQWAGQGAPLSRALPAAELMMLLESEMLMSLELLRGAVGHRYLADDGKA